MFASGAQPQTFTAPACFAQLLELLSLFRSFFWMALYPPPKTFLILLHLRESGISNFGLLPM